MGFFKDITSPFSSLGSKIKSGFSSLGKKIKNTDWEQLSYDIIDKNASFVNTLDTYTGGLLHFVPYYGVYAGASNVAKGLADIQRKSNKGEDINWRDWVGVGIDGAFALGAGSNAKNELKSLYNVGKRFKTFNRYENTLGSLGKGVLKDLRRGYIAGDKELESIGKFIKGNPIKSLLGTGVALGTGGVGLKEYYDKPKDNFKFIQVQTDADTKNLINKTINN